MATITESRLTGRNQLYHLIVSEPAVPGDTVEITVEEKNGNTHCFIGVQMYDSNGDLVIPTAGQFEYSVKTLNTVQWEDPPVKKTNANKPQTISVAGNIVGIRVVNTPNLSGNDVTTFRVYVTLNRR